MNLSGRVRVTKCAVRVSVLQTLWDDNLHRCDAMSDVLVICTGLQNSSSVVKYSAGENHADKIDAKIDSVP